MSCIRFVLGWVAVLFFKSLLTQAIPPVRASEIRTFQNILAHVTLYVDTAAQPGFAVPTAFSRPLSTDSITVRIPFSQWHYPHYLKFSVYNDLPDTAHFYFYADMQQSMLLQETHNGQSRLLPVKEYRGRLASGTQTFYLSIPPSQTIEYCTKIIPLKSQYAEITPALIHPAYISQLFANDYQLLHWELVQMTVFCGMLAMMLLYIFFKFLQSRSREYLYYAGYIFCFLIYFFLKSNAFNLLSVYHFSFFSFYLVSHSQVWAYCMYFAFFRYFLNVAETLPRLNRMLLWATRFLIVYSVADFFLYFFPSLYPVRWMVWDIIRVALIVFSVVALFVIVRLKNKLMHYIFAGSLAVSVFGLLAMVFSIYYRWIENWPVPLQSPLFYFQLGITIELLCFSLGLGYKNRQDEMARIEATEALKYERERQTFERYKATAEAREAERRRIASEMHDDIGSGLTSILFLSNVIHRHAQNGQVEATEKIATMASGLVDKMNNIIWSMNKEYDTLPDLIAYVRSHISELLDNAGITYQFDVQEPVPDLMLNGEQRRNLYLVINEAVHNCIKHARATQVTVRFRVGSDIRITIADNGVGMADLNGRKFGNGFKNMRQRMADINGTLEVVSEVGQGTRISLGVEPSLLSVEKV